MPINHLSLTAVTRVCAELLGQFGFGPTIELEHLDDREGKTQFHQHLFYMFFAW